MERGFCIILTQTKVEEPPYKTGFSPGQELLDSGSGLFSPTIRPTDESFLKAQPMYSPNPILKISDLIEATASILATQDSSVFRLQGYLFFCFVLETLISSRCVLFTHGGFLRNYSAPG